MASSKEQPDGKNVELQPGKHLPLRYNVFPKDIHERPACVLRGSTEEKTTAYIFCYPFDIVIEGQIADICGVDLDGRKSNDLPAISQSLRL